MRRQRCHLVEYGAQVLLDLVAHIDLLLEEVDIVHPRVLGEVDDARLHWVDLVQVGYHDLMDLLSQLLLGQAADRVRHVLSKRLIDLLFVKVYCRLWILQMLDIVEHVEGVLQRHQEVVHLVEAMPVSDDLLEEQGEERSVPVKESAARCFAHDHFPAAHHLQLVIPVLDLLELALVEYVSVDQAQAVRNYRLPELIVAALVALNDVHHELHHVVLDRPLLLLHAVDLLHAALDLTHDEFTRVAIDQDDPFVDEELLGLELDLDRLQHLYGLNNHREGGSGHLCIVLLEEKKVNLEASLDLSGQLDAVCDLVGSDLEEIFVLEHSVRVLQTVGIHERDPLDQAHVVVLDL